MNFNNHSNIQGMHAFLSPSSYSWINYEPQKIIDTYKRKTAMQKGTELHELAANLIKNGIDLPKNKNTFNLYVNDAIGYRMLPEVVLMYSENCFGTADTICFRDNFLRIHDLKTGETPASIKQLEIYEALFCLEYGKKPETIKAELRLYQSDIVNVHSPNPKEIRRIMDQIILGDSLIKKVNSMII